MSQRRGAYAPEFRQQSVELVKAGRRPNELAREFGCYDTSICAWVRQAQADQQSSGRADAPLTTAERQELVQLQRQLRQVTQGSQYTSVAFGKRCLRQRHGRKLLRNVGMRVDRSTLLANQASSASGHLYLD